METAIIDELVEIEIDQNQTSNESGNDSNVEYFYEYVLGYDPDLQSPLAMSVVTSIWLGSVIVLATLGNAAMCWCVLGHRRVRTVTNCFILNLSIADLLNAVANVPFVGYYTVQQSWPFGRAFCKFQILVGNSVVSAIAFTFVAISIERYVAILHPFRRHISIRSTVLIMIGIWFLAVVIALPAAVLGEVGADESGRTLACDTMWSGVQEKQDWAQLLYNSTMVAVQYLAPLCVLCFTYTRIGNVLWHQPALGLAALVRNTSREDSSIQAKRKVVRMMVTVVSAFGTCWLPMHAYFAVTQIQPDFRHNLVYSLCFQIAMSNSACNPLIYYHFNRRFRCCVLYILRCLPGCRSTGITERYVELFTNNREVASVLRCTRVSRVRAQQPEATDALEKKAAYVTVTSRAPSPVTGVDNYENYNKSNSFRTYGERLKVKSGKELVVNSKSI